jgi:cytochrome c peroxidase
MKAAILLRSRVAGAAWIAGVLVALTAPFAVAQTPLEAPKAFFWYNGVTPGVAGTDESGAPDFGVLDENSPYKIIKNKNAAIALGKALFWDQAIGSDGQACASCHFVAGADTRLTNQLSPGFKDETFPQDPNAAGQHGYTGDIKFGSTRTDFSWGNSNYVPPGYMISGAKADSNYKLKPADLPLHRLSDEANRNSPIISTTNDRISSQGAFSGLFTETKPANEACAGPDPSVFHAGGGAARQVEPRNTPTMINAVFKDRVFWDFRANNLFNGVDPFGQRTIDKDPNARLLQFDAFGKPVAVALKVENASLASQAVGPPLSNLEMSCSNRRFADIGRKVLATTPLSVQSVSKTDSVLGALVKSSGYGLNTTYASLIQQAFDPSWWGGPAQKYRMDTTSHQWVVDNASGYTQPEINFSMFWGLAIQLYESTLITAGSTKTEFDVRQDRGTSKGGGLVLTTGFAGPPTNNTCTVTLINDPARDADLRLLERGCKIFARLSGPPFPDGVKGGNCFVCHNATAGGAAGNGTPSHHRLLTEGTTVQGEAFSLFLTVTDVNGKNDLRDQGGSVLGLREALSDPMSGGVDPYGGPLSYGRQLLNATVSDPSEAGNGTFAPNYDTSKLLDPELRRLVKSWPNLKNVPGAGGLGSGGPNGAVPNFVKGLTPTAGQYYKLEVDGSSNVPILRNVALTPPYFSWGGYPSLRQVLKTYNRGMNRRDIPHGTGPKDGTVDNNYGTQCTTGDNSGSGPYGIFSELKEKHETDCSTNTTGLIVPLGLLDCEQTDKSGRSICWGTNFDKKTDDLAALERFLKSLTDTRVACSQAPFDHPGLTVNDGHTPVTKVDYTVKAADIKFLMPASGSAGYPLTSGYCIPNAGDLFAVGMQALSGGAKAPTYTPPVIP